MTSRSEAVLEEKLGAVWPMLDERTRRLLAANEALALGYGGVSCVHRACGLSRAAITSGIREIEEGVQLAPGRVRRSGAGRHRISHVTVADLLHAQGYSLQSNRKVEEGGDHPDRDAQFRHINATVRRALAAKNPVISVDTKKKELLGNYANAGRQWRRIKEPVTVNGHDFPSPAVPRAFPYGIYDIGRNEGFVNVGTDHDTGAFAVASIRGWWRAEGRLLYLSLIHISEPT